jgi:methyl-accepting chemotaxis protein
MNFLANVRIGTRLVIGFGAVLAFSIISTSFSLVNARHNADAMKEMMKNPLAKERIASDWYLLIYSAIARTSMIAKSSDQTLSTVFAKDISESVTNGSKAVKNIEALLSSDRETDLFKSSVALREKYQDAKVKVMTAKQNGDADGADHLYKDVFVPAASAYQNQVLEFSSFQRKAIDEMAQEIDRANARSFDLMLLLGVLLVATGSFFAYIISRSITLPLKSAVELTEKVAAGDLTTSIDTAARDEIGDLKRALKRMNDSLLEIVGGVRAGTDTIATASSQIAAGNLDLSSRTEQQASSLEETASSMEELTSTVKQNADNARQANTLAVSASEVAGRGGAVVSQVIDTMAAINDSSKKISDIIGVIDGIAFQTNILALNAAVEAARAGEQGRGFAVVASEVRNLAQRSAAAAKEIKTLINDSVATVDGGAKLVDQAGATMEEVVESVKRVTNIMSEIMAATQEQSAGIDQINQAISQMDQVTQQTASLVEEAAAASEAMQDQATQLAHVVSVFKLDSTQARAVAPAPTVTYRARQMAAPAKKQASLPLPTPGRPRPAHRQIATASSNDGWEEF